MTAQEVITKMAEYSEIESSLSRMTQLLHHIGDPQKDIPFVHVGGTNGKGSVSAMLYAIYNRCEYKAGLFTSPHLYAMNERIQVDGKAIPDEKLAELGEIVFHGADKMLAEGSVHPSELELSFAIALLHYKEQRTDVVIVELVEKGGEDITNAIPVPVVTVITNIDVEETGENLEKVALDKGGIIKEGSKVVLYHQQPEVMSVIQGLCKEKSVPCMISRPASVKKISQSPAAQKFTVDSKAYQISLTGEHQLANVALVLETVQTLKECSFGFSAKGIFAGLSRTVWPGRFERVHINPDFILDSCHTVQSVQAMVKTLQELYPNKTILFLVGVLEDHDYQAMLDLVLPLGNRYITLTPNKANALPAEDLAKYLHGKTAYPIEPAPDVGTAVDMAMEFAGTEDVVCAFGSLHTVGEIRHILGLC